MGRIPVIATIAVVMVGAAVLLVWQPAHGGGRPRQLATQSRSRTIYFATRAAYGNLRICTKQGSPPMVSCKSPLAISP